MKTVVWMKCSEVSAWRMSVRISVMCALLEIRETAGLSGDRKSGKNWMCTVEVSWIRRRWNLYFHKITIALTHQFIWNNNNEFFK